MSVLPPIAAMAGQLAEWRHRIHAQPELGFEEHRTSAFIAECLTGMGLKPVTGIGGTGVVATVEGRAPGPAIGLRADMDALPMNDESGKPYASAIPGRSHACGHDGHSTSLLGAAAYLAKHPPATGRVHLIFQPSEEEATGAAAMIEDGLFERFPCDEIYGFHNMPLLGAGKAGVKAGPTLSAVTDFTISITGVGGHGASPHKVKDPLQAAARLAVEISAIVGRHIDPMQPGVITVGRLTAGTSHNIIPETAELCGSLRSLSREVQETMIARLRALCDGIGTMTGCTIDLVLPHDCPACVNAEGPALVAADACRDVLGAANVANLATAYPFADDFSFMLNRVPGAYLFLGQDGVMVHNPAYDFSDALLPVAASVFARIAERRLNN